MTLMLAALTVRETSEGVAPEIREAKRSLKLACAASSNELTSPASVKTLVSTERTALPGERAGVGGGGSMGGGSDGGRSTTSGVPLSMFRTLLDWWVEGGAMSGEAIGGGDEPSLACSALYSSPSTATFSSPASAAATQSDSGISVAKTMRLLLGRQLRKGRSTTSYVKAARTRAMAMAASLCVRGPK